MSQINLHKIIRQQQEQLAVMQVQIQVLLTGRGGEAEVVKPQIFDGTVARVASFITACKLYIRMKIREELVEGQVQ